MRSSVQFSELHQKEKKVQPRELKVWFRISSEHRKWTIFYVYYNKILHIINLQREKVDFCLQFWRCWLMNVRLHCFGPMVRLHITEGLCGGEKHSLHDQQASRALLLPSRAYYQLPEVLPLGPTSYSCHHPPTTKLLSHRLLGGIYNSEHSSPPAWIGTIASVYMGTMCHRQTHVQVTAAPKSRPLPSVRHLETWRTFMVFP